MGLLFVSFWKLYDSILPSSYWVSILEAEHPSVAPWLFETDLYKNGVLDVPIGIILVSLAVTVWCGGEHILNNLNCLAYYLMGYITCSHVVFFSSIMVIFEKIRDRLGAQGFVIILLILCGVIMGTIIVNFVLYIFGFRLSALFGRLAWKAVFLTEYFSWKDWGGVQGWTSLTIVPICSTQ